MTTKIPVELSSTPGIVDGSNATAITINSSEQVMIGTTDAGYPDYGDSLTVADVDGGGGNAGMTIRSGTSSYGTFYFSDATGTAAGTYAGKIQYNHSTNSMVFATNSVDQLTIDSAGDVIVGDTAVIRGSSQDGVSIEPEGRIYLSRGTGTGGFTHLGFYNGNGLVGHITSTNAATAYSTSSDYRLKENISYEFDALSRVAQLKPARFNFISHKDIIVDGFLAHEVSDIVPEAITGEKDAVDDEGNAIYQGIDQSKLVPLLTKAIQEQQTIIDDLKSRIETLEAGE